MRKGWLGIVGLTLGAIAIVVGFNFAIFLLFLMPPGLGALWVAALGALHLAWHLRRGKEGRPGRLAARIRLRRPRASAGRLARIVGSTLLVMLGGSTFVGMGTGPLDVQDSPFHRDVLAYIESGAGWAVFAFAAAVVVPMVEEFAFRGRLQRRLERRWGPAPAVLFAASVFAVVHAGGPHPLLLVVPLTMGIFCGIAAILTRSIWTAVLMHGAWNGLVALLSGFASGLAPDPEAASGPFAVPLAVAMIGAGLLGWTLILRDPARAGGEGDAPDPSGLTEG